MSGLFIPDQNIYIEEFKPNFTDSLDGLLTNISHKSFDYWCSHFVSILQCLHYHVNLQKSPFTLRNYPNWSLADLRGRNSYSYVEHIEPYLRNWGFQYFLINFLNSELGTSISSALRLAIANVNNFKEYEKHKYFRFEISGRDSHLSRLSYLDTQRKFRSHIYEGDHVAYNSDIALGLSTHMDGSGTSILAFGEVEGNYGHQLLTDRFWDRKHPDLDFGIGVVKNKEPKKRKNISSLFTPQKEPEITLNYYKHRGSYKAVILIKRNHNIVQDYYDAIQILRDVYYYGPECRVYHNMSQELREICFMFKAGFDTPVIELIEQFKYYSDFDNFIDPTKYTSNQLVRTDI